MIPIQHVDSHGPNGAPAFVDEKTGDVMDRAGDRIGRSEPSESLTIKLSNYIGKVASSDKRLLDLMPRDVDSGKGYGILSPDAGEAVADIASPIELVDQVLGTRFYEDPFSATKQVLVSATEAGSEVPTTNMAPIKVAYDCAMYGLAVDVPSGHIAQADFDILKSSAYRLGIGLRLAREVRVANLLTAVGSWASNNQRVLAAGTKWNGGVSADPLADLFAVMNASTLPITDIIMSEAVLPYFLTSNAAAVTRMQNFAMALDAFPSIVFPRITIAKMKTVVAGVPSYIWGSATAANIVLIRRPEIAEGLSSSRTFRWPGASEDGVTNPLGYHVRTFWAQKSGGRGSMGLIVVSNDHEKMLANTVGGIITGAIQ